MAAIVDRHLYPPPARSMIARFLKHKFPSPSSFSFLSISLCLAECPVVVPIERKMTIEEAEPNPHVLGWIEDSVPLFPSFLDDPYDPAEINGYNWWDPNQDFAHDLINTSSASIASTVTTADSNTHADTTAVTTHTATDPTAAATTNHSEESVKQETSKKRKASLGNQDHTRRRNRSVSTIENPGSFNVKAAKPVLGGVKRPSSKKRPAMSSGNNSNGGNKEGRWAEQLLNPCAAAITANNLTRVQHLLYVLHELASPTGDPNHRLASHGLRALTYHLSPSTSLPSSAPFTFSSAEPRFFQKSLLRFNESSPWFAFPSNIVNSSILQVLSDEPDKSRNLHIVDIGVSHGAQWPTLLDNLSRRPGGPPPLVRLTVISPTGEGGNADIPFSMAPPGHDVSPLLLGFAKTLNINLEINRPGKLPLQSLNPQSINTSPDETLIVSAQFRLHYLSHSDRTEFLKSIRALSPKGMILTENNENCACAGCVDFATGFSRRIEYLWRFLDSTSAAFKGRETEERRLMEGEAARALTSTAEMNEGRERWCERMREAGFTGEGLGEDAIDGGRALLRKHDGNWEMKVEEDGGSHCCVSLGWKGQPVSFCSLWKLSGGGK
ncbi:hypothetical protein ACJRO7_005589 [Eucalyptus globulus]|uniref:Nodulation signaling pathway 1-like protein n=1 Tax=Eucalyptus globulus TaxID=34317 RepID=A0ABD3J386_EUCGL